MEHLVEAVARIACISSSEARLALLLTADALRSVISQAEALELAATLPLELALLVGQAPDETSDLDLEPTRDEVGDLLGERTVAAVCSILAMESPESLRRRLVFELPPRLMRVLHAIPASGTWTRASSNRPTIRVDSAAMTRPTVKLRVVG